MNKVWDSAWILSELDWELFFRATCTKQLYILKRKIFQYNLLQSSGLFFTGTLFWIACMVTFQMKWKSQGVYLILIRFIKNLIF